MDPEVEPVSALEPCGASRKSMQAQRKSYYKMMSVVASSIREVKQEMEQGSETHQQPTLPAGSAGARDSGYESLRSSLGVLDRLAQTIAVWLLLGFSEEDAGRALRSQPAGVFLVRRSQRRQKKVLSLRMPDACRPVVCDFPVKESDYAFSLEGSSLCFADLINLMAFYCTSRDILPCTLRLPQALVAARRVSDLEQLTQLGAEFWETHEAQTPRSPTQIHKRETLCFLNPLFLQDPCCRASTCQDTTPAPSVPPSQKEETMPVLAYWIQPGLVSEDGSTFTNVEEALQRCRAKSDVTCIDRTAIRRGVEWIHKSQNRPSDCSVSSLSSSSDLHDSLEQVLRPTGSCTEEEDCGLQIQQDPPPRRMRSSAQNRRPNLRKMSLAFSSLLKPERRVVKHVQDLAHSSHSYFGQLVQAYVDLQQASGSFHVSSLELLQTVRQFLTQTKAYLLQGGELDLPIHTLIPEERIDYVLEKAMQKCVLKPLKATLDKTLLDFHERSGEWQQLQENMTLAKTREPRELGVDGPTVPDAAAMKKIRKKFCKMARAYSPEKKVSILLRICKMIYSIMEGESGATYGADDFLPVLVYVLVHSDMPKLNMEIEYMMELLDPSLLMGEGGYYLTSAYGAMSLIKNFQEEQAARTLSSETCDTLQKWHRRRTALLCSVYLEDLHPQMLRDG